MSTPLRIVLWTGGDSPSLDKQLTVEPTGGPREMRFSAYWAPGYCGCPDCSPIVGLGATEQEAIEDYKERWREKYAAD